MGVRNTALPKSTWFGGAALMLGACGGGEIDLEPYVVRDSAGIQIVETVTPTWGTGSAWRIAATPEVRIGLQEGDGRYLFSRVVGAIRLADGRIVVGDGTSNEIRFYDGAGRFIHAVGGTGQGPGEFEYLRALQRCSEDGFYAFDINWQAKVYASDGTLRREMRVLEPGLERSPYRLSCSIHGEFVISGWGDRPPQPPVGLYTTTTPVWILDADMEVRAEIGEFVSSDRIGSETGSRPHPFGRTTVVAVDRENVYVGPSERLEILVYDLQGGLKTIIRGPPVDLEIRPEHLEYYREQLLEEWGGERRQQVEREVGDLPPLLGFPAYDELQIDEEGSAWLRRFSRPGDEDAFWVVFDRHGVMLGSVTVPRGLSVAEIGPDYVLGIHEDELGVERVQLHRLEKES